MNIVNNVQISNGEQLDLDQLTTFLGYQIRHKITGRMLPQTNLDDIYTSHAAMQKVVEISKFYEQMNFDISEYEFIPMYDIEFKNGWKLITHEKDWNNK